MRRVQSIVALGLIGLLGQVWTATATAEEGSGTSPKVIKVEETWELKVGEPNLERNAPQVTMVMSQSGDVEGRHFVFVLNHRTKPDYAAGGMQLQRWNGEYFRAYSTGANTAELTHEDETVTWTQSLEITEDERVAFKITEGTSTSWGDFGGDSTTQLTSWHWNDDLNSYTPYTSITESGIDFAGNRVVSLTLMRVRWHMDDGQVYQMDAPIDIDSDLDPWNGQ